jgi:hypothetical protein
MAKCTITVTVDVNGLTQDNVNTNVTLVDTDNGRDDTPGNSSTFRSKVNGSTNIDWHPQSKDGVDTINITNIAINDGEPDIFATGQSPSGPDNQGDWSAKVKANDSTKSMEAEYSIWFQVNNQGTVYLLDPKLEIKPA